MSYTLRFKNSVRKDSKRLSPEVFDRIIAKVYSDLLPDPRRGEPMKGKGRPLWKFRVGDYRVLYVFSDTELWVLVVRVGHRREVYRTP